MQLCRTGSRSGDLFTVTSCTPTSLPPSTSSRWESLSRFPTWPSSMQISTSLSHGSRMLPRPFAFPSPPCLTLRDARENDVSDAGLGPTFMDKFSSSGTSEVFELKPGGAEISVTEENKTEYVTAAQTISSHLHVSCPSESCSLRPPRHPQPAGTSISCVSTTLKGAFKIRSRPSLQGCSKSFRRTSCPSLTSCNSTSVFSPLSPLQFLGRLMLVWRLFQALVSGLCDVNVADWEKVRPLLPWLVGAVGGTNENYFG